MSRWRHALLLVTLSIGCGPGGRTEASDAAPPIVLPPRPDLEDKEPSACPGLPASGMCQAGVAVVCDATGREPMESRTDCNALQKQCVIEVGAGAVCSDVGSTGATDGVCGNGIDFRGFCAGSTAIWCNEKDAETELWPCASSGLFCQEDTCADGAYCCTASGALATDACGEIDSYGECGGADGQTARFCLRDGLHEVDCAAQGKQCVVDGCATGAFCCDECDLIGLGGVCDGDAVRYCEGGVIEGYTCDPDEPCQVGACFWGAECCPAGGGA
jgi:hypothetical protein